MGRKSIGLIFAAFIFMAFFSACITHIEKNRVNVGDTIPFGRHNWNVLDLDGDYALIISTRNVTTSTYNINWEPVTWETSGIREWLNLSFINSFNEAEQARIRETAVSNSNNPWFNTDGGNDTVDKIFLLSIDEIIKYFTGGMPLVNLGDPDILGWTIDGINPINAVSSGHGATNWWWLRSPGKHAFHGSTVVTEGELIVYVEYVHRHGGVRPAMWVRVID